MSKLSLDYPEAAATQAEEAWELLLLQAAKHIQMARAQNYRPLVPVEYQCDILYAEPDAEVVAKVKDEKVYRAESRVGLNF